MTYTTCSNCNKLISNSNIKKHISSCVNNIINKNDIYKFTLNEETKKYVCLYCNKEYTKYGIYPHIWRKHSEEGKELDPNIGYKLNDRIGTNQYIKAEQLGLDKPHVSVETRQKLSNSNKGKSIHTDEFKQEQRERAIERKLGGIRQSKQIEYNNKILGSSYELMLAQDLDKYNIKWDTCKRIKYLDNNLKQRTYTPDIYLIDYGIYLDPKNDFLINNINPSLGFSDFDKIKWVQEQNNLKIFILNKNQLSWDYIKESIIDKL